MSLTSFEFSVGRIDDNWDDSNGVSTPPYLIYRFIGFAIGVETTVLGAFICSSMMVLGVFLYMVIIPKKFVRWAGILSGAFLGLIGLAIVFFIFRLR